MQSLCKPKTIICLLFAAILAGVLLLVVYPIYSVTAIHWPEIDAHEELLSGCNQLLEQYPEGTDLPKSAWPETLLRIQPRYVFVEDSYIKIVISSGGISSGWGLIVDPSNSSTSIPSYVSETEHAGIYRYK
jgi:Tfp pilus assembly protein PilE